MAFPVLLAASWIASCSGASLRVALGASNSTSVSDVLAHAAAARAAADSATDTAKKSIVSSAGSLKSAGGMSEWEQYKQQQKVEAAAKKHGVPVPAAPAASSSSVS